MSNRFKISKYNLNKKCKPQNSKNSSDDECDEEYKNYEYCEYIKNCHNRNFSLKPTFFACYIAKLKDKIIGVIS